MNNKGFTLIEVLITTAVMAIIGGLMTGIFYTVTSVNQRETASGEVTSQLNFVTQTIQRLVRESSNVEIEAGTATTTLKLRMADSAKDPTCIIFASSSIRLAQGPDATNAENCTSEVSDLTNDKVVVDSVNFKKFTQYPGHDTVSFDIAMTYNSQDPAAQIQRTLQSAVARVSAATFDSNLLPGDTTFTIGQAGSAWQNIIASDGTAANPSYTFGNSLGLGLFRAGDDILGFSTAGVERIRIDATGTSTFTGNIFLAGATSTYRITNVASPVDGSDVATKAYVDAAAGGTSFPSGYIGRFASSTAIDGWTYLTSETLSNETWTSKTVIPTVRSSPAVVALNNKVYVIGGGNSSYTDLATNEEYDPATNAWTTKTSMTAGSYNTVAAVANGKIYAIGGYLYSPASFLSRNYEYNPSTNAWTTKTSMTTGRGFHTAVTVNNKIYAIGGYNATSTYLTTNEEYDPATNAWTTKTSMTTARGYMDADAVNGKIYVVGGNNASISYMSINEEYDPSTNAWTTKTSMPTGRYGLSVSAANGKIYAIGGYNATSTYLNTNEEYDPSTNGWTTRGNMITARTYFDSAAVNNKIYAIAGQTAAFKSENEEYTPPFYLYLFSKD
jgi:prepilin-type N-terminal cleavage/methylation domain-containing protein